MSLNKIAAGDFGYELKLTYYDTDTGAIEDLSAYTTSQEIIVRAPDGSKSAKSGSFDTDGSDGVVKITVADGDIPLGWAGKKCATRIRVTSASGQLTSDWEEFTPT